MERGSGLGSAFPDGQLRYERGGQVWEQGAVVSSSKRRRRRVDGQINRYLDGLTDMISTD